MTSGPVRSESGPGCSKCGEPQTPKGRGWNCKPCAREYHREYYQRNKEKLAAANRLNYELNRDAYKRRASEWKRKNRSKVAALDAAYYQRNRDEILAKQVARYLADPTRFAEASTRWAKANPEARRAMLARRRARLRDAICEHGPDCVDAAFLADVYSSVCTYCPSRAEHADHFMPLAKGGLHCRENVVPACSPCNVKKLDHDPIEWMESRAG